MAEGRTLVWVSAGVPSAVAAKLTVSANPTAVLVYCDTGSEHPDNARFLRDLEKWCGVEVTRLKSDRYGSTWDVWEHRKYLAGPKGAPCTTEMKVVPRLAYQRPYDTHVFGYTADKTDVKRAERFRANFFELAVKTPLIERGLTRQQCFGLLHKAGIKQPAMYKLGFSNNNCIACVKAQSPNYWAAVRRHFPDAFQRMATLSRRLGYRLTMIHGELKFIDEIPLHWPTNNAVAPHCDFLCRMIEEEIG